MARNSLVLGVSTRALFSLEEENAIYEAQGFEGFGRYQLAKRNEILKPGSALPMIKKLVSLNSHLEDRTVRVVISSRNHPHITDRVRNSIDAYGFAVHGMSFTGGMPTYPYLTGHGVGLYLTRSAQDARGALDHGLAAALLHGDAPGNEAREQLRFAFDGDAVIFSDESERVYQEHGVDEFRRREREKRAELLEPGPFNDLVRRLAAIKEMLKESGKQDLLRMLLVTSRGYEVHHRVLFTLAQSGINLDEVHFMDGERKTGILRAIDPDMFFDDAPGHVTSASMYVPSAEVLSNVRHTRSAVQGE